MLVFVELSLTGRGQYRHATLFHEPAPLAGFGQGAQERARGHLPTIVYRISLDGGQD
jgi:hypothetical protein